MNLNNLDTKNIEDVIWGNVTQVGEQGLIILKPKITKNIDKIICLGDCFSLGPEPEGTLELLKSIKNCTFIRGNHDRYLIEKIWKDEVPPIMNKEDLISFQKLINLIHKLSNLREFRKFKKIKPKTVEDITLS